MIDNDAKSSAIPDFVTRAKQDLLECSQKIEAARQDAQVMWEHLAGLYQAEMLRSDESAQALLTHPDAKVRMAALIILRQRWKPPCFRNICERLAISDPDSQVQGIAVISLGQFFSGTGDRAAGKFLAEIVQDSTKETRLRHHAYNALFELRDLPLDSWPAVREIEESFKFPDDVDWAFVDSFLL